VVANAVAVPAVLGLVALGAAAVVSRSLVDMAGHRLGRSSGKRASGTSSRQRRSESGHKLRVEPRSGR
jgi:hypothetical protein